MTSWLPVDWPLVNSFATATIGFIIGIGGKAMIEKFIQHELDKKLEIHRTQTVRREAEVAALREMSLSRQSSRNDALDKRRLEALDKIWCTVVELMPFEHLAKMCERIDMDAALKISAGGGHDSIGVKAFADTLLKSHKIEDCKPSYQPYAERPYLSPMVWAMYSAYAQSVKYPAVQLHTIRAGLEAEILADPQTLLDMIKVALPGQAKFVDKYGSNAICFLVHDLKEALLVEINNSLDTSKIDEQGLEIAVKVIEAVNKASQTPVDGEIPEKIVRR
ncbi:hypothetical protein [Kordiimonas sp.]|uniref:hypothetical protein n=1 Tax=Kordiimonas sp. TaxID=1970157 RepID=UPI003A929259